MEFIKLHLGWLTRFGQRVQIFIAKGPAYHYVYGRWRVNRWLGRWLDGTAILDDQTFFAQLNLESPELRQVKRAVGEENYSEAKLDITAYFRTRDTPRFFFEPADIKLTIALIGMDQREATIRVADEIRQNIFHFRGADPVKFEADIDWTYCPQGNTDWTWDLNRHVYFEILGRAYWYTGDERYVQKFRDLLLSWVVNNPAGVNQLNWASIFEVAFRINTWLWAFYYFRSAATFDQETCLALLKGLLAHGHHLEANLEFHTRNNHLLLEAKSLVMLGLLFPEFKAAKRWQRQGLKTLYKQIRAQVCSDGVYGERATHYHRVVAGELLELLILLENSDVHIPSEIRETFARMVEFELWVTKPDGLIPLLADSALEDTHLRFSAASGGPVFLERNDLKSVAPPLDESDIWLLGHRRVVEYQNSPATKFHLNSRAFLDGGYIIMRTGEHRAEATYLIFDCGPFGYKLEPYHGHADALSFELYACGQTLLVDPGIYSAHLGQEWRLFFRGSRAHNTVVVDDQDQSILVDSRRVYRQAQTTLHQWISSQHFDFVDGSHNGYERFPEPVTHRRQIFFVKPEYWVVIDLLTGYGQHCFDLFFHLMPGIDPRLEAESNSINTGNGMTPGLAIVPLATRGLQADIITGATNPIQGWVSFYSGEKLPAPTARYRQECPAPVQFCTVLYPYLAETNPSVTVSSLDVEVESRRSTDDIKITSICIRTDKHLDRLIIDRRSVRTLKAFAGYETDAQLLYMRHQKDDGDRVKVVMRGGDRLFFQGESLLKRDDPAIDFIVDYEL